VETLCTKEKNHSGQPNLGNQLSEEITNYRNFVLTALSSSHSLEF